MNQTASEGRISVRSCHSIRHDVLNMRLVCQHLVPRMLLPEQKHEHFSCPY